MQELSDFSSLVQLGAGVAFALAIFFRPLDNQRDRCLKRINDDLTIGKARKSRRISDLQSEYNSSSLDLDGVVAGAKDNMKLPLALIAFGVVINLIFLLFCTFFPSALVSLGWAIAIASLSILPYLIGYLWIEVVTRQMARSFLKSRGNATTSPPNTAP